MESSVLRFVLLIILFLILTADYPALVMKVVRMLGLDETPSGKGKTSKSGGGGVGGGDDGATPTVDDEKTSALSDAMEMFAASSKSKLMSTIKNSCLPKLICELNASHKEKLSESEKTLLALIRDTTISVTAEVTSRYHFAAHMGQLIAGVDGAGCHNFYPTCPFPGMQVLQMLNKVSRVAR